MTSEPAQDPQTQPTDPPQDPLAGHDVQTDRATGSDQPAPSGPPTIQDVRRTFNEQLEPHERSALLAWLAFTVTFATVRGITHGIRAGKGPFRNLSVGGEHLHHYMWGIGMIAGVGGVAVRGEDRHRRHPAVALAYGIGLALIVDEFALLLDLQDVYWAKQGRISVDLGVGGAALGGTALAARPLFTRLMQGRRTH